MLIGSTTTRIIGGVVLALATAALLAPAASGKPTPRVGSLERARVGSLERALRVTETERDMALRSVYSDFVQPRNVLGSRFDRLSPEVAPQVAPQPAAPRPAVADDTGRSFDWGLAGALSAVAAVCLALGAATVVLARQRGRPAHP